LTERNVLPAAIHEPIPELRGVVVDEVLKRTGDDERQDILIGYAVQQRDHDIKRDIGDRPGRDQAEEPIAELVWVLREEPVRSVCRGKATVVREVPVHKSIQILAVQHEVDHGQVLIP
jgi:hypothetical protein